MVLPSALDICRDLVRCASVTPEDAGALAVLERILKPSGFVTHRLRFEAPNTPTVDNLYARIGHEAPCLVFAGHTDVVPAGDAARWRHDPFAAEITDGMIWGRGTADMKGGLAAAVAAALVYLAGTPSPRGSIAFLVTGDEEGPAINGTTRLLEWAAAKGERFDHCILGEPTNPARLGDMMKIGRRGSLVATLHVQGRQGHTGYPHLADNPVHHIVRLLAGLRATPLDAGNAHFEPSNIEITTIDVGNPTSNIIPGEASATFNIRFNDFWTPQGLSEEIRGRLAAVAGTAHYTLQVKPTNATAFLTQPGPFTDLVADAVAAETGRHPVLSTSGGTSDARFIKSYCPVVEFGLVGQTMHAVDEHVAVEDLERLSAIYRRVLDAYFARKD